MLTRLCSVFGRMRPPLFALALVALLLSGLYGRMAGRRSGAGDRRTGRSAFLRHVQRF